MHTAYFLMAQYGATAVIPLDSVCRDYFSHMTPAQFMRKANAGELDLPITRVDPASKKSAVGVHIADLAEFIDKRREGSRLLFKKLLRCRQAFCERRRVSQQIADRGGILGLKYLHCSVPTCDNRTLRLITERGTHCHVTDRRGFHELFALLVP